MILPQGRY